MKNYFEKFKDLKSEKEKVIPIAIPKTPNEEFAEFIRYFARLDFSKEPRDDVFVSDSTSGSRLGGETAQQAVIAAKHYLSENESNGLLARYNKGLNDKTRYDKKFDHVIRWTYDGCYTYLHQQTALDYFVNLAFENFEEADKIIDEIEKHHETDTLSVSAYSLVALASAGKKEIVKKTLNYLENSYRHVQGLFAQDGKDPKLAKYDWDHFYIEPNVLFALAYHMIGDYKKRDRIIEQMQKLPCFVDDVFTDYSQFFTKKNPINFSGKGPDKICPEEISPDMEATSLYLELMKHVDAKQYEATKNAVMDVFRNLDIKDHEKYLGPNKQLNDYFAFFTAAQKEPMFSMK